MPDQKPKIRPSIKQRLIFTIAVAVIYALVLYVIVWMPAGSAIPFISGLILVPMAIASVASAAMDPLGQDTMWRHIKIGWICITAFIVIAVLVFREAGICAIMAAPIFYLGSALGSAISGLSLRKWRSRSVSSCLVVLPLLALPAEPFMPAPVLDGQVQSVVVIDAPLETVWKNTVEIPKIAPQELMWTFSHGVVGVPQPIDARLEGAGVGAVRHLRWTHGVTFEEVVTDWQPGRHLAWTFRFGPQSIPDAVEGHIKIDSSYLRIANGDYRLDPLPDGKTRLSLTTHYAIATPINVYCAWWGSIFLRDFHGTVLNVIQKRSEAEARSS